MNNNIHRFETSRDSVSNAAGAPKLFCFVQNMAVLISAITGALIAATGALALVALSGHNLGPLNALCSLGPYGGAAFLISGSLITTIAVSNCLLCKALPNRSDMKGGNNDSENVTSTQNTEKAEKQKEMVVTDNGFASKHEETIIIHPSKKFSKVADFDVIPKLRNLSKTPETMDSFVGELREHPQLLAKCINHLDDVPSPLSQWQQFGATDQTKIYCLLVDAIIRAGDELFILVMTYPSLRNFPKLPYSKLTSEITSAQAKLIVSQNLPINVLSIYRSLVAAMVLEKSSQITKRVTHSHDRVLQEARNQWGDALMRQMLIDLHSKNDEENLYWGTPQEKAAFHQRIQADIDSIPKTKEMIDDNHGLSADDDWSGDSDFEETSFKVILYNFPKTADSFVEDGKKSPGELAKLINFPQTEFDDVLGSIAILAAIRRREDNLFEKVMHSCLESERIPFELFVPQLTDWEAKTIVGICKNNTHKLTALRSTYTAQFKIPGGRVDIDGLRAILLSAMQERLRGRVRFILEEIKTKVSQETIPSKEVRRANIQQYIVKAIQTDIDAMSH